MESTRLDAKVGIDRHDLQTPCLEEQKCIHRGGGIPLVDPAQHIDDFSEIERAEVCRLGGAPQLAFDIRSRRLIEQERDDRLSVEYRQCDAPGSGSDPASSSRVRWRASVAVGSPTRPLRIAPRAAPIGSSGSGRKTNSLPRSSTRTRFVPHRWRTSAGIETWPPLEIVACFMSGSIAHEPWLST